MDIKEIESDINTRNFSDSNSGGTILHMYTNAKTKLSSVIMEVLPETYKMVRENDKRLFVGHQKVTTKLINVIVTKQNAQTVSLVTKYTEQTYILIILHQI